MYCLIPTVPGNILSWLERETANRGIDAALGKLLRNSLGKMQAGAVVLFYLLDGQGFLAEARELNKFFLNLL